MKKSAPISTVDRIIAAGALAAALGCFLPWYRIHGLAVFARDGFYGFGLLSFIAAVLSLLVFALSREGYKFPPASQKFLSFVVMGGASVEMVRMLIDTGTRGIYIGIFVTLIGGITMWWGDYQNEERS